MKLGTGQVSILIRTHFVSRCVYYIYGMHWYEEMPSGMK